MTRKATSQETATLPQALRVLSGGLRVQRLVILGNGMVSAHLCRRLKERDLLRRFDVVVVGAEPMPAYDRVHLSRRVAGATAGELELASATWYEDNKIELKLGDAASFVDLEQSQVRTTSGKTFTYDHLVFATGSRPRLPPFDGNDHAAVTTFRDQRDADRINELAATSRATERPLVILGGGLLGIELAEVLHKRSVEVVIVESSSYLLPRQLTRNAARLVATQLRGAGYRLELNTRIRSVHTTPSNGDALVRVELDSDKSLIAAGVIVATGVRPHDEVARAAGIRCDTYGGIEVDDSMRTSTPNVWAVGECARHANTCYGLVAPGYQMAEVLLDALSGKQARFEGVRVSTRLKVESIELSVVGDSYLEGVDVRNVVQASDSSYRSLVLRNGRLIGATSIGPWPSFANVQAAVGRQARFSSRQAIRFTRGREPWSADVIDANAWEDSAIVCSCTGVTCGALREARADGCEDAQRLRERTGAGTVCGTCEPLLVSLATGKTTAREGLGVALLPLSLIAGLLCVAIALAPRIPLVEQTVGDWSYDALWRNGTIRQVSGFSAAGVMLAASALSLRKRIARVRFGSFRSWRTVHFALGALALIALVAHTGFRLGYGFDRVLMVAVLAASMLGAVAGAVLSLERRLGPARGAALRRLYNALHFALTWPLPILVGVHVAKVYFF